MSTTGFGDILPMTNWERSYALCVMLVGVVLSALVFGVLAQIITEAFDHLPTDTQHQSEVRSCSCAHSLKPATTFPTFSELGCVANSN
jgi:hypothetical protein